MVFPAAEIPCWAEGEALADVEGLVPKQQHPLCHTETTDHHHTHRVFYLGTEHTRTHTHTNRQTNKLWSNINICTQTHTFSFGLREREMDLITELGGMES